MGSLQTHPYLFFVDDGPRADLLTAIDHHLHYLDKFPPEKNTVIGSRTVTYACLIDSLTCFRKLVEENPDPIRLNREVRKNFEIIEAAGRNQQKEMLVTGYYEPLFDGSLVSDPPYIYPLYKTPGSLVRRKDRATGKQETGRIVGDGSLAPYWSRAEIENKKLLAGNELVYLRDPLDAYLLHVQGSGRIRLPDGSIRSIHFAASNGRPYNSLGKLFVDKAIMAREEVSIPRIRAYFQEHPEKIRPMLQHNPRYIFFSWGNDNGPRGSLGEVLTPGRSIAIDHSKLPAGLIGYLESKRPVLDSTGEINHWRTFGRFVLPQDSGSAIKGTGRVDLFWGFGEYAETAASHMNEKGKLYFLLKKPFELPTKIK